MHFNLSRFRRIHALAMLLLMAGSAAHAVGIQDVIAPDSDDKPLTVRIWYPNEPGNNGKVAGHDLPLIVFSHGTGGSLTGHADTAIALAEAGFVAAAVMHTGDNYQDQSYVSHGQHLMMMIGRPRHLSRVIDYMLTIWPEHGRIDPTRIGVFGHSAGGFTALVVAGAEPDVTRGAAHCRERPQAWDCLYLKKNGVDLEKRSVRTPPVWTHDARVKAAVIAAPAIGYLFEPNGLSQVKIPIQLWEAGQDSIVEDSPSIVRRLLPRAPDYHAVPAASHVAFLAPCDWRMQGLITVMSWFGTLNICVDPVGFDRTAFHKQFNAGVVGFFARTLQLRQH